MFLSPLCDAFLSILHFAVIWDQSLSMHMTDAVYLFNIHTGLQEDRSVDSYFTCHTVSKAVTSVKHFKSNFCRALKNMPIKVPLTVHTALNIAGSKEGCTTKAQNC